MKVTRIVPLLAVATLGIAACGSDDSSDAATTDAPAASAVPADTAEVAPEATTPAASTPAGTDAGTPAGAAGLQLINTEFGSVLADGDGFTLYVFTPDAQGDSTCYDECAANWPFAAEVSDVGDGLDASLLGTTERTTGETQATYNGWPLYTFGGDPGPGLTNGQGVGDVWYVIDATGTAVDND
jgi:predicted lipoprotein with Yx(FWY)xxD motif